MAIHDNYTKLNKAEIEAVDEAFKAAGAVLRAHNIRTCGDDRAERVVEALATWVKESNPGV